MKLKNLLCTLGLTLTLGIGVGVGLAANKGVKAAEAAKDDPLANYYVVGDGITGRGWNDTAVADYQFKEDTDGSYIWEGSFSVERFRILKGDGNWTTQMNSDNLDATSEKVADGTFVVASTVTSDNAKNIWCTVAGTYVLRISSDKTKIGVELPAGNFYTVSYDEDGNGTAENTEMVEENGTINGYTPFKYGHHFDYWTLNSAQFNPTTPITGDITLTAHWTALEADESIYLVTGYNTSWTGRYIYAYDSQDNGNNAKKNFGVWPGMKVEDAIEGVTSTTNFGGGNSGQWNGGIMKVNFFDEFSCDKVIIHDNNGSEVILDVADGAAYFYAADLTSGVYRTTNGGYAAEFVYKFDKLLSGKDFCNELTPTECAALYNQYLAAIDERDDDKGWIDSSCINTENGGDNVQLATILAELRKIAVRDGKTVNDARVMTVIDSNSMIYIVVIAFAAISACGLFFVIKRRKHSVK